jgi:hypothetical protein
LQLHPTSALRDPQDRSFGSLLDRLRADFRSGRIATAADFAAWLHIEGAQLTLNACIRPDQPLPGFLRLSPAIVTNRRELAALRRRYLGTLHRPGDFARRSPMPVTVAILWVRPDDAGRVRRYGPPHEAIPISYYDLVLISRREDDLRSLSAVGRGLVTLRGGEA